MRVVFILIFLVARLNAYEYEIAIGAIFQDEARFMKEWIEFHKLIGVEHFYLYNNNSKDHYLEVLQPYIDKGEVELIDWNDDFTTLAEWNKIQCAAYTDCINKTKKSVMWLALIDLDEFIVPVQKSNLKTFLKEYENFSGVGVNWQYYGSSNVSVIPEGELMIDLLLNKAPEQGKGHKVVKSIIRPSKASHCINPHWVYYIAGHHVNANKEQYDTYATSHVAVDKIRINHYFAGDMMKLVNVKYPRIKRYSPNYTLEELLEADRTCSSVHDPIMKKFVPALKERMKESIEL